MLSHNDGKIASGDDERDAGVNDEDDDCDSNFAGIY